MTENTKPEPRVSIRSQSVVSHRSNIERLPILAESMRNGVSLLLERWMKTEGAAAGHTWVPDSTVAFIVDEFEDEVVDDDGNPLDPPRFEPYTRVTAERPYIEGPGVLVTAGGWCAPSDQMFTLDETSCNEVWNAVAPVPEVRALRGGERWEEAGARMRAARAARRAAAIAAGIPEEELDGNQAHQSMSQNGHWEYAVRDEEGGLTESFLTAQEAFDETMFGPGDVIVRRWVERPDPWEIVS